MKVKIVGNEIIFPVDDIVNEKEQYNKIENFLLGLSQEYNVKFVGTQDGPWYKFKEYSLNGKAFNLVYDYDDDETYIMSESDETLKLLKQILQEA